MEIVPVLHVRDGQAMVGRPGAWEPMPTPYPDGGDDVVGLARHLSVRFGRVGIVDLGAGRTDDAHHNLYQKLAKQNVALWIDARPETLEDVLDLFVAGADRVTVRMDRMDADDLVEVLDMADGEVWLGYAFRNLDELHRQLRERDPFRFLDAGAEGIVLIDLERAGTTSGPDPRAVDAIPYKDVPVYVAGGIASPEHIDLLDELGAAGALVGTAALNDTDAWARRAKERRGDADEPPATGPPSEAGFTVESPASPLPGVLPGSGPKARVRREED